MDRALYKSLVSVDRERLDEEIAKQERLSATHSKKAADLKADAKDEADLASKADEKMRSLIRAGDEGGGGAWELKDGSLTTEEPDSQTSFA